MSNLKYQKGRKIEYWVKKQLESKGNVCLRTAGSHGFADIIAINKRIGTISFIQIKYSKTPREPFKHEINKFVNELPILLSGVYREIWIVSKGKKISKTIVNTIQEAWG